MKVDELKKKFLTKKGVSLFSQVAVIVLVFGIYVLGDYLSFGGTMQFATRPEYWITTTTSIVLLIVMMITTRNMRKDKRIAENKDIENNMRTVHAVRKVVLINAYGDELQAYLDKINEDYKYETYINNITNKINKLPYKIFIGKEKKDKLLQEYEKQLKVPREEVLKMNIRFRKITQTGLFANVNGKLAVSSKHDISPHETKDIVEMASYKSIVYVLLTAISGTMFVSFMFGGWGAIWGTMLKICAVFMANNSAIRQADTFVDYNIEQALDNRLSIILGFVNTNEEIKAKVLEKLNEE